jgi:hypothetical protein
LFAVTCTLELMVAVRKSIRSPNRGLRSGLVSTPDQLQEQIGKFGETGVDLLLLQFSAQLEEIAF